MTSNVLDGYTFAHVVSLYDSLVQNDAGDKSVDPPELYMYLMVRPNCLQRLIALQVQADSGRGLTDVAVYREASPAEGANDVSRGDDMLSITPDFVEEELYDDDEDVSEEGRFSQENTNDIEGEAETTELDAQATELAEDSPHHDSDYAEETEEIADDGLGDVLDYDNLDLTPPQQGKSPSSFSSPIPTHCLGVIDCGCDTCWLQRVEEDVAPHFPSGYGQSSKLSLSRTLSISSSDGVSLPGTTGSGREAAWETFSKRGLPETNIIRSQDPVSNTTNGTSSPHNATAALDNGRHHEDLGTAANGGQPNVAHSESTSATATLDGESSDKLNYDENDLGVNHDDDVPSISMTLMPPIDEEITWESENEEGRTEQSQVPKSSERVSTTPGKRTRSDSGVTALATGRKGT